MTDESDHDILIRIDQRLTTAIDGFNKDVGDHEERIRCLETNQNRFLGIIMAISAFMGVIGNRISTVLFGGN